MSKKSTTAVAARVRLPLSQQKHLPKAGGPPFPLQDSAASSRRLLLQAAFALVFPNSGFFLRGSLKPLVTLLPPVTPSKHKGLKGNKTTNQETEQAVKTKREKTARDELLKARVSKSFKALVEETAVARGQTPSEAMRQALQEDYNMKTVGPQRRTRAKMPTPRCRQKQKKATKGSKAERWVNLRVGGLKPRLEGGAPQAIPDEEVPLGDPLSKEAMEAIALLSGAPMAEAA
uniref:RHH_1 domain-containing protein n=1 Tax=Heterorhabditis bacteriophora TaxID=37862 RepID=A0A1I7WCZ8_HETBA